MNRPLLFCVLIFFGVVGVTLTGGQKQAIGGHGCHGCHGYSNCSGYSGCDGCYGCSGCDGCDGCWGGRRVVVRRRLWSGCHGHSSCHGCSGYQNCSGCQGCSGCHGCWGEATEVPAEPAPEAPVEDQARLNVQVPADAVVIINDHTTSSKGTDRSYVSKGLNAGGTYRYEVRAEITRNGETFSETKVIELGADQSADLTFDLNPPQVASVTTR